MRHKLGKICCYVLIIILLPYTVTIFLNGPMVINRTDVEERRVVVKDKNNQELSISLKDYAIGILAREIPATYESETIKAQAIMVRTKIYKEIQEKGSDTIFMEEYFTPADMKDAWGSVKYTSYYNKLENAWHDTQGQVLMYKGELVYTPFFSLSNGNTRDGKEVLGKVYPYLKIKECPLDIEVTEQLQTVTLDQDYAQVPIEIIKTDTAGYVLKVRVGEEEVNGEEFRKNYNLVSSCFSIHEYEGKIRITTRGVGHGIGLSQNTANKMAEDGKTAGESPVVLLIFSDFSSFDSMGVVC